MTGLVGFAWRNYVKKEHCGQNLMHVLIEFGTYGTWLWLLTDSMKKIETVVAGLVHHQQILAAVAAAKHHSSAHYFND